MPPLAKAAASRARFGFDTASMLTIALRIGHRYLVLGTADILSSLLVIPDGKRARPRNLDLEHPAFGLNRFGIPESARF